MKNVLLTCLMACLSAGANAALIGLVDGEPVERAALVETLTSLGHTVTTTIDGSLDLIITAPGNDTSDFAGVPYLQISDHGEGHLANDYQDIAQGTPVQITLDGEHPILTGLDPSWTTLGFWNYASVIEDYIGWVTGVPGLADALVLGITHNEVLAVSGTDIYIGWTVYGVDATSNDIQLLDNAIQFLTAPPPPPPPPEVVPTMSAYGLALTTLGLFVVAARRLSSRRQ